MVTAPPTYPIVDRVPDTRALPIRDLTMRAMNRDGEIVDFAAYEELLAVADAHLFIGPAVEVYP